MHHITKNILFKYKISLEHNCHNDNQHIFIKMGQRIEVFIRLNTVILKVKYIKRNKTHIDTAAKNSVKNYKPSALEKSQEICKKYISTTENNYHTRIALEMILLL